LLTKLGYTDREMRLGWLRDQPSGSW